MICLIHVLGSNFWQQQKAREFLMTKNLAKKRNTTKMKNIILGKVTLLYALCCAYQSATKSCPTLCNPMDSIPPSSSVHEDSPGKNTGMGCHALLQGNLPNPGIKPRKPNDTEVGSLSLLQGIFPTQESNPSLLHCRRILYQLNYQGT